MMHFSALTPPGKNTPPKHSFSIPRFIGLLEIKLGLLFALGVLLLVPGALFINRKYFSVNNVLISGGPATTLLYETTIRGTDATRSGPAAGSFRIFLLPHHVIRETTSGQKVFFSMIRDDQGNGWRFDQAKGLFRDLPRAIVADSKGEPVNSVVEYRPVNTTLQIGNFNCNNFNLFRKDQLLARVCLSDPGLKESEKSLLKLAGLVRVIPGTSVPLIVIREQIIEKDEVKFVQTLKSIGQTIAPDIVLK